MSTTNFRETTLARMQAITTRLETLNAKHRLSAADDVEHTRLVDEFDNLRAELDKLDQLDAMQHGLKTGRCKIDTGSQDRHTTYGGTVRDHAMRLIDRRHKTGRLTDDAAETVEKLTANPAAARWAVATGTPEYERAFTKLFTGTNGHLRWTNEESAAYRAVEELRFEQRALGIGSNGHGGGAMLPLHLDPAILLTNTGTTSSLRQIARVETIATNTWHGVTSAGVTAEWRDEHAESSDGTPDLDDPTVPVHRGSAFVPYSFEIEQDAEQFLTELAKLLLDSALQLSEKAYTTGSGTGEPTGFVTALAAASPSVQVTPDTAETLGASDLYKVQNALPPRFQANSTWAANLTVWNVLRQMETGNGALKFPGLQDVPAHLLGRPAVEQSHMDGTWNAAQTADNHVLTIGDFKQFLIVDRIGATLERVEHLVGSSRRPTGQRGALLWFRTGSDVLVPNAFRMLNIATTA